jgi:hypothetical protein
LVLLVIFCFGWPANIATWVAVLCSGALPVVSVLIRGQRKRQALLLAGLYCLILVFPFETNALLDFHSGRTGIDATLVWRGGPTLRYREDGPNTAMLQRLLVPRAEAWRCAGLRSTFFGLGSWRDGSDVTVGSAMIGDPYLREALDRLPNEQARVRVLTCLSDPANVARIHQEQLLLTLCALGYPKGHDAASWWRKHEDLFRPEPDAAVVARLVWGLHDRFLAVLGRASNDDQARHHLFVLDHHLRPSPIGGDRALAGAIMERLIDTEGDDKMPADAWINRIAWWPTAVGGGSANRD